MKETIEFILMALIISALFGKLTTRKDPDGGVDIEFDFPASNKMNIKNGILFLILIVGFYLLTKY